MRGLLLLAAAVLIVVAAVALSPSFTGKTLYKEQNLNVTKVVDGDTLRLSSGEKVRLLNIDTPERGQYLWKEATERMRELTEGRNITLEKDVTEKDKYGRLLRYAYASGTMLNLVMVREGFARSYFIAPDDKHLAEIKEAEEYAKSRNLGIWRYDNITGAFCVWVYDTHPDPKGRDELDLNGEYVVLRNSCGHPQDMTGWTLSAERGNYTLPAFALKAKSLVTVHSGSGENNSTDLYWGSAKPVWKNDDDRLLLFNAEGVVLDYGL
jgi:endonuclease YncB( thermonuclease family)